MPFEGMSSALNATITTNSGGTITFAGESTGGQARFITNSGGVFDMSALTTAGMTAGSIEGAGNYFLGSKQLTVGLNDLSTQISGVIADSGVAGGTGGSLVKVGTGTLTLLGTNTYSGGTSFNGGILAVESDANLGTGPLSFNGGTLEALAAGGGITSAKAVMLDALGGTFLADVGTASVLSGLIIGPGSFTKDGAGELTLTADNSYSGGTTISGGTLQLGNGGTTGSIVGDVTDNGTLVFNRSGAKKTFAGVISGSGELVKMGSDTLVLTANNTYGGGTIINEGTLVAGVPNAAQAISNALGVGDVFLNGGTLRTPSLDPLVINIPGNYTQGPGGTLALGIGGLDGSQYDHVQVAGKASLNGTLAVSSLNNFRPANLNAFEVLSTGGRRSGEFSTIDDSLNNNPNLQRIDIYAPNGVALVYVATGPGPGPSPPPGPTPTPPPGPTPTPVPTPPPIPDVIPEPLPPVDPNKPLLLSFLLKVLNPTAEQLTSLFEIPFSGANTQRFNLDNRFAEIQRGLTGFVSPLPQPGPGKGTVFQKDGKTVSQPPVFQSGPQNRWGVWVNGWGDFVSVDDDNFAKGYNFTTGGGSVGIDYRITDSLAVGIFGSYAHTWTDLKPGDVDVNTGRGGLYATYWNKGFYINGAVYGGHNSYDTSRQQLIRGMANGSTSGYEFSTFSEAGYDFHFGNSSVGPLASLQYTNVHVDGYSERGSFLLLNIHSDSEESLRTDLGVQASYAWQIGKVLVIPNVQAFWEHEYKYSALPITFSAANFPGVTATAFGPNEGHDSAIINAGVGAQWTPRISTFVGYQGQLGRSNYEANGVTGTFSFSF